MERKYKGIIFDLDGVLCHTDHYHYQAWKKLADRLEIPFNETDNNRLRGVSRMESLEIILEKSTVSYSPEEKQKFAEVKNETYKKLLQQMKPSDISEEVRETLSLLKSYFSLAVGSSSKNTGLILQKTDMEKYFDAVADGNDIQNSKPDPEVFLVAADRLHLSPAVCLVVEDAKAGVDAAIAGGFGCAGIGDAAGYDAVDWPLQNFGELKKLLPEGEQR